MACTPNITSLFGRFRAPENRFYSTVTLEMTSSRNLQVESVETGSKIAVTLAHTDQQTTMRAALAQPGRFLFPGDK
jgi:hypothetical protein